MKRTRYLVVAVIVMVLGFYWLFKNPTPIEFASIPEASVNIKAAGYHCTSDRADGIIQHGFMVTQEETDWQVANNLCKVGHMGQEWKGKVWVTYSNGNGTLCVVPEDASTRSWGGVMAYGDVDLLNQIEGNLRRSM